MAKLTFYGDKEQVDRFKKLMGDSVEHIEFKKGKTPEFDKDKVWRNIEKRLNENKETPD
jgi:hypothetical protein